MTVKDPDTVKQIIRSNFDASAVHYNNFEERYGLFERLTDELAVACSIRKGMSVCDIGCGTGTSTAVLARYVGDEGKVIGIDFSDEMLDVAKERFGSLGNIGFISCDAERLYEKIDFKLDAVLYNASIFLIPNPDRALESAFEVLETDGIVGMNHLTGIFDREGGVNLFRSAKEEGMECAPYGRDIMDTGALPDILAKVGFRDVRAGVTAIEMTIEEMREFYSIPAQSAGLYPRAPYEERLIMLDTLLDHILNKNVTPLYQLWSWQICRK